MPERRGEPQELELLEGVVERTVYHDLDSRWTVLRVHVQGEATLVTFVGRSLGVEDGAEVSAHGRWTVHPSHGRQFQFEHLKLRQPTTETQIVARLKTYPGIKDVMAERIVKRFGTDTLDIFDKQPRRLLEVAGLGQKTLEAITEHHDSRQGPIAGLENRLLELEVSPRLGKILHDRYGDGAMAMLEHHPYRLAREVRGIGFATADKIARALGVDLDSDERVDAGIVHALERAQNEGHCALPPRQLIEQARAVLGLPSARVETGVDRLIDDGELVPRLRPADEGPEELYFLRRFDVAEDNLVEHLRGLAMNPCAAWPVGDLPDHLSPGQRRAVEAVARCGVVILTGGPGTGKSTVVANVIAVAAAAGEALILTAPTGRAAKRLEQTTGKSASTVHRLLEVRPESGEFNYCANNPLDSGLVVVDESSMLDLELAESLITALTPKNRLLLVGDADQLPSVGPGNVLRDLIRAAEQLGPTGPIPVVRLDTIFRQQEGSTIVTNAHRVLHGEALVPDQPSRGKTGEFFVLRASDAERTHARIVEMAAERVPAAYGLDPIGEIQVLCPMHKGKAGTEAFNLALQARYTGDNEGLEIPGPRGADARLFRVGDRVMQIRNDYDRGVFNGDIGVVSRVNQGAGDMTVDFDGVYATYARKDLGSLRLAYAISIHKSQGSEFPAVLIPLLGEHHVMLRRNLLYTAITRARRLCVIVGDPRAIERAIRRADAARRWTGLAERTVAFFAPQGDLGAVIEFEE
ncbi:ATP-dependent RecD-like DNA helicase [Pseudenhygromyxa sp. WMMC2535]|uniref:SF1B family DNA helicase RecD2 n=1 Tax=Pseudenhygromyxa sp. WMMC2535 TaxID=2712867 RepID=UPI001555F558|nr:ATP-dependent RecD-like DNA helicase [Pseudenhygromyxa sp. WMMC2535]NVB42470.1 ATP-dependent RecD-like DNA helicase [Pseudenhygromyxa sp. WMMC2535]